MSSAATNSRKTTLLLNHNANVLRFKPWKFKPQSHLLSENLNSVLSCQQFALYSPLATAVTIVNPAKNLHGRLSLVSWKIAFVSPLVFIVWAKSLFNPRRRGTFLRLASVVCSLWLIYKHIYRFFSKTLLLESLESENISHLVYSIISPQKN